MCFDSDRFGCRIDTVSKKPHVNLFSSLGIDVHVYGAIDALIDDDNRKFPVHAAGQYAPQLRVFWSVFLRVINREVPKSSPMDDHALYPGRDDGLNVFSMKPRASQELCNALTWFIPRRVLGLWAGQGCFLAFAGTPDSVLFRILLR